MRNKILILAILILATLTLAKTISSDRYNGLSKIIDIPEELLNYINFPDNFSLQTVETTISPHKIYSINIPYEFISKKPLYFSAVNTNAKETMVNILLNDKNWISNAGIVNTILMRTPNASSENKALAFWEYLTDNFAIGIPIIKDKFTFSQLNAPVQFFNSFGFGECGNFASVLAILANEAGLKARRVDLEGHAVTEIFYNNSWHLFDSNLGIIIRNNDGSIASVEDVFNNQKLLAQVNQFPKKYPVSQTVFTNAFSKKKVLGYFSPARIEASLPLQTPQNMSYLLRSNEKIFFFNNFGYRFLPHFVDIDSPDLTPKKYFTNGILVTPFNSKLKIELPYPIVGSYISIKDKCANTTNSFMVSSDEAVWSEMQPISRCIFKANDSFFSSQDDFSIINKYYLKTNNTNPSFTQDNAKVFTIFQLSSSSIPNLDNENNTIKIDSEDITSDLRLTFGVTDN